MNGIERKTRGCPTGSRPRVALFLSAALACLSLAFLPARTLAEAAPADARTVRLATAEWPPYLGAFLPGQGAIAEVLRETLATQGYRLDLRFYPWARTLQLVRDPSQPLDGYVVDYYGEAVAREYRLTKPVATSPLVLAERAGPPLGWRTVDDLARFRLGLVRGYINTAEIDDRLARGLLHADYVPDDAASVRLLLAKRVDAIVIDRRVLAWLLSRHAAGGPKGIGNVRVLEEKALYACLRRDARGARLQAAIDAGLARIDSRSVIDRYLVRIGVTGASAK